MTDPDIIVGVDFGMTCTGVAYSLGPEWSNPVTVQHWPGKMISEIVNKVATLVSYDPKTKNLNGWGFLCDHSFGKSDIKEWFKLELDPEHNSSDPDRSHVHEVRQWFRDYMRCLHTCLSETLSNVFPRFNSQKVEFLFSVPTTWKSPHMILDIKRLLTEAGFGQDGSNHSIDIPLTESEAAAVYVAKQQCSKGEVILVCDAGGGTTDVNILKLESSPGEPAELKQLSWVEGRAIGSTQIDTGFQRLIVERLKNIRNFLEDDPQYIAEQMTYGRFENFKCSYGYPLGIETLPILVPGLRAGMNFPELEIEDSHMYLRKAELKELFDAQITRMFILLDQQMETLQNNCPEEMISYLVLSGGLGSSPYVKKMLVSRYQTEAGVNMPNARNIAIKLVDEPQLAVVRGLVMNRIQQIVHRQEVFKQRCCRASYGILVHELYDPVRHIGEVPDKDPLTGTVWALNQIDWLIKKGTPVFENSIQKKYHKKFRMGTEAEPWSAKIVMSDEPAGRLPQSLKYEGARIICRVATVLPRHEMKIKNRHWYQTRPRYLRSDFFVKLIIGVADLKFELISKDGVTCSSGHDAIEVAWGAERLVAATDANSGMYKMG